MTGPRIANRTRPDLTASAALMAVAADDARRRVLRDLHDGAQQRLVHTLIALKLAERALHAHDEQAEALVGEALENAERAIAELRELAHGIGPSGLTTGGLAVAVQTLADRSGLRVGVDIEGARLPAEIEHAAYFIIAEALTNIIKHARTLHAEVRAMLDNGTLRVEVRDDGVGGADPQGAGLVGMADRVTALEGMLAIESPRNGGTSLSAALPLRSTPSRRVGDSPASLVAGRGTE
jgi:signal transduction histidine kinase